MWGRAVLAALVLVACSHETGREHTRGRLRCVQHEVAQWQTFGSNVYWDVFFDGEQLELERRPSDCRASPDPDAELLALTYDGVRVQDGVAVVTRLHAGPEYALWACDGRCLVHQGGGTLAGGIDHIDTGSFEPFPQLPGQPISLAPDQRSVVTSLGTYMVTPSDTTLSLCVVDLDTETAVRWTVPRASMPALERCPDSIGLAEFGECLGERGAAFTWVRDASGRDVLAAPIEPPGTTKRAGPLKGCAGPQR